MSSATDTFRSLLKASGNSITKARLAVFGSLLNQEPMSMHELVNRTPAIDRASIYRAVDLFERLGIVQRLNTGWKYRVELTDKFTTHHHHLTCTVCGQTVAMNEAELEQFIEALSRRHGFTPRAHQVEIQGVCANCQVQ